MRRFRKFYQRGQTANLRAHNSSGKRGLFAELSTELSTEPEGWDFPGIFLTYQCTVYCLLVTLTMAHSCSLSRIRPFSVTAHLRTCQS